ncbi:MAG: MarR family transcriptional regulator [Candidatus Marinimicrobia bacterium]|nr:MarR family transcriptional regulator [Candidatus Neomarinimicrobiota bacterium]MCF7829637.1 MarR family transcriptional regulator [Candidatus Neomarinimicrobiota bacterium]MCF7879797.1 MarR family transcriptional regulator [Candidatus Neomarinimicrobiota bacterium]
MSEREQQVGTAFGYVFILAQRWQNLGDEFLGRWGLTTKQWLLLATMEHFPGGPPTLGEASEAYGSSYQNVRRIASDLEMAGFIKLKNDPEDKRTLRLHLTDKNRAFWAERDSEAQAFVNHLFGSLTDEEVGQLARIIPKLSEHAGEIGQELKEGKI